MDEGIAPPPKYRVSLNGNVVDGRNITGGLSSWQLYPNGARISPVSAKNPEPVTASNANQLFMYGQSGDYDLYYPTSTADFKPGEDILFTGPMSVPGQGDQFTMKGLTSTILINFAYAGSGKA